MPLCGELGSVCANNENKKLQISVKLSDIENRVKAIFVEIPCGFKKSKTDQ